MASQTAPVTCANPLFLKWVNGWLREARQRNSRLQHVYRRAYDSLSECTEVLQTAQEAKRLKGIGDALATKLQARLDQHRMEIGQVPAEPAVSGPGSPAADAVAPVAAAPAPRRRRTTNYVPRYRSGAFAILLALHVLTHRERRRTRGDGTDHETWLSKFAIVEVAKHFCDATFDLSARGGAYSAWSAMKALVDKELVYRFGTATDYALSEDGESLALQMLSVTQERDPNFATTLEDIGFDALDDEITTDPPTALIEPEPLCTPAPLATDPGRPPRPPGLAAPSRRPFLVPHAPTQSDEPPILMSDGQAITPAAFSAGAYQIFLVLDNREIRSRTDRGFIRVELENRGVPVLIRNLELGDIMWVARPYSCTDADEELFLGYIVERKRMDDLVASIRDGRYKEQKNRLRSCGAEHVIYLVEGSHAEEERRIGTNAIQTVLSETQVLHGFAMKRTASLEATLDYLGRVTAQIQAKFQDRTLHRIPASHVDRTTYPALKRDLQTRYPDRIWCISYRALSHIASKSGYLTLGDLFVKMLMTVKGMSAEKALHLSRRYPTPIR
ncbi:Crossover junction endonuclease mus81 [Tieghemiomyces parasiticus]|uniref:Crossover junction endonuclease MUS81 n=1 Tax=Tieghemiomyces parasiticus TaxID=78921 RepID=A0A9W8E045_9FUNG|nr:Crossover junction endonuclease mus81 [Tieghemiomyces parasiticus]